MKYRHGYHAGNFADVHKHVALLALLRALQLKDKGFLYLDTHAGRGSYDLSTPTAEAAAGIERFLAGSYEAAELRDYAALVRAFRVPATQRHRYPGSPLLAARELRPQDRMVLIELQGAEVHALEGSLAAYAGGGPGGSPRLRIERGDGFERLRAFLPPVERRALTLLDPPYEETQEFARVAAGVGEALRRLPTGVVAAWYPIKEERTTNAWLAAQARRLTAPVLVSELWLYPRDARVGLNGSGLLIANPPWRLLERMQVWLPQLAAGLAVGPRGGSSVRMLSQSAQ